MNKFQIVFNNQITENYLLEDYILYDIWSTLDIKIDGISFFEKFKEEYYIETGDYIEGKMTGSSISSEGITVPTLPTIESIIDGLLKIDKKKEMVIEDFTGQSSKQIVCKLQGNEILFAIKQEGRNIFQKDIWYNGENLITMNEFPVSRINIVEFNYFKNGCIIGIEEYLRHLISTNPHCKNFKTIENMVRTLSKYFNLNLI